MTGRLGRTLTPRAARIVFGANADAAIDAELPYLTAIDEAHVVMLAERGLIETTAAADLMTEIESLRATDFAVLRGRPAPRGVYLLYEAHLIDKLGADVGGVLHTGRSRNDLKATTHQLRMREVVGATTRELLRLQAVLLSRARTFADTVMAGYSQFQPATPITYGYYLLGIAESLDRDLTGFVQATAGIDQCPLGAAAGAGTDVPIDPARTAELLGFAVPVGHAGHAIASRDTLLRILSAAVLTGVTLSRLATDLQQWSTPEFGLITFPDSLVGSSSAMPQKRNPFLLEHIKGGAGALIGAWTAAASIAKAAPFGNSIEASTDGVRPVWAAMTDLQDIVQLAVCVAAGARPCPERMLRGAHTGFTVATAVANRLVAQGVPFRSAHSATGGLVTELIADGFESFAEVAEGSIAERLGETLATDVTITAGDTDPAAVVAATEYGGGPGPNSSRAIHTRLAERWRTQVRRLSSAEQRRRDADRRRLRAAHELVASTTGGPR